MLLTLFALVAFIGLVWNTGEYATRKHNIQAAADAAAHSAQTWNSRTSNIVSATNQLIAENGSAEVILRATGATVEAIRLRLEGETARIQQQLDQIDQQRDNNNNNPQGADPNLALELDLKEGVLQAVLDDYSIQEGMYEQYAAQVTPALSITTPDQLAQRRADILSYQENVVGQTPDTIDQQRAAMAGFYKCDIALGTPAGTEPGPPVKTVDHTNIEGIHVDGVSVPDGDSSVWVVGGTWGRINCPPLGRYFDDRVARDVGMDRQDSQIPLLQAIDGERQRMGQLIQEMLTVPPNADSGTQASLSRDDPAWHGRGHCVCAGDLRPLSDTLLGQRQRLPGRLQPHLPRRVSAQLRAAVADEIS
ncbi:MAG: pilus assembly protein TadG-related protein [Tepidisphaeraceae bacterium]